MSTSSSSGRPARRWWSDDPEEWATLTPEALRDEIRANRRDERRLVVLGLLAAAMTITVIVLHGTVG